ncbi:MAG: hypothetical protein OEZ36_10910, partial [Spirochaetota bacterium]|nr:hypothetical protein [Spirochaetota bacterium]
MHQSQKPLLPLSLKRDRTSTEASLKQILPSSTKNLTLFLIFIFSFCCRIAKSFRFVLYLAPIALWNEKTPDIQNTF